jgi:cytochrome c peroxidase
MGGYAMQKGRLSLQILSVVSIAGALLLQASATAQIDPNSVRAAAAAAGLKSLKGMPVPTPDLAAAGILNPLNRNAKRDLIRLGKAAFWDQQFGSDGQTCASCHFEAGADRRIKNQINPATRRAIPVPCRDANNPDTCNISDPDYVFGNSVIDGVPGFLDFGPNYTFEPNDFPFHKLANPEDNNFVNRMVLRDTDDVASSQGVFNAEYLKVRRLIPRDKGIPAPDPVFDVAGINTRRVEPRNTPTNINAVFNFANLWDGRAHNVFNGVSPFGPLDVNATILVNGPGGLREQPFAIANSSLASQAVAPPTSNLEMSFDGRDFADVGKKMVRRRPLAMQMVHPKDSVLGPLASTIVFRGRVIGFAGINTTYAALIRSSFHPKYWNSLVPITINDDGARNIGSTSTDANQVFTQMEANFSLFFGLAVQAYEATLIADDTPLDRFLAGDNNALTQEQLHGLLIFINKGSECGVSRNPAAVDTAIAAAEASLGSAIGAGNCISCHMGPELTAASVRSVSAQPIATNDRALVLAGGLLQLGTQTVCRDEGFFNTGVRPTSEDLGRGSREVNSPLSFTRQALLNAPYSHPALPCTRGVDCPNRVQVDGAFKTPQLRNVELTGPYFSNGGQGTLMQVVRFYERQGDFSDLNIRDLYVEMAFIDFGSADEAPLVKLMIGMTDERVRNKMAPFDHPQFFAFNGHPGDQTVITRVNPLISFQAADDMLEIYPVGAGGLPTAGLPPLKPFLNLDPLMP